jgi:hypothetical protein
MQSIEMVEEFCEFFLTLFPNNKGVIYLSEPTCRFVCCVFYGSLFEIFQKEIGYYRGEW